MEDINCWEPKFEICSYSSRLLEKIDLLNKQVAQKVEINEVKKAIFYAKKYHGSQLRKSDEPYYSHPLEVAYLFAEYVGKEERQYYKTDLILATILHDTIEDTSLTKEIIVKIFNESVASKVDDLTRIKIDKKITAGETLELLYPQKKKIFYILKYLIDCIICKQYLLFLKLKKEIR